MAVDSMDRRKFNAIHDIGLPVLVAVLVGGFSSYITATVAIAVLNEKVESLKTDYTQLMTIANAVSTNQIRLERFEEWRQSTISSIERNKDKLLLIEQSQYTKEDGRRDAELLRLEIMLLKEESAGNAAQDRP